MVHDVFVSYSNKDKTIADSIVASLERNNIRCWYAPRDIKPSEDWGNAISNAIEKSKIFLIIFSGNSNQSRRVLDELNLAIAQELTILPFRIEKLEPGGAMRLHLSSRHWLDAYDPSWESHLRKLINTTSSYVESTIAERDVRVPESFAQRKKALKNKKIRQILVGIAAVVLVVSVAGFGLASLINTGDDSQASNPVTTEQVIEPTEARVEDQGEPTQEATHTPEQVVQQPQFSLIGPPEWRQFTSNEISVWLPATWDGGDPAEELDQILDAIEEANPDFAEYTAVIRANPEAFLYWGFDLESSSSFLTNMNIVTETVPSSISVSQYIDIVTGQLPEMYTLISTDTYSKGEYQAGEIVSQVDIEGVQIGQISFILRGDRSIFSMTLTTELSLFDQRIDTFRQIFEYFEIAPGL